MIRRNRWFIAAYTAILAFAVFAGAVLLPNAARADVEFAYSTFYNDGTTPWAVQWKDGSGQYTGFLPAGRWVDPYATHFDARWVYNPTGRCIILLRRSTPGFGPDRWIDTGHYTYPTWIFLANYDGPDAGGSQPTSWLVIGRRTTSCA